jgi:DNA-binding NarL/FixJ family response regulator
MTSIPEIRVWLDEPNAIFRRGMNSCLVHDGFVVSGESADFDPDPDLKRTNILVFALDDAGAGLRRAVRSVAGADVRIVAVAANPTEEILFDAVEAGLAGFLIRSDLTPDRLVACLRSVVGGNGSMPSGLLARVMAGLASGARRGASSGNLAPRELDVLRLLAEGGDTREIAEELLYSERTVKNIVHDVLAKMQCRTRAQAVALATRRGVI